MATTSNTNAQPATTGDIIGLIILWLIASVCAVILYLTPVGLAALCAQQSGFIMWILYMLWAAILGPIYLIYYLIYRVFMKNSC